MRLSKKGIIGPFVLILLFCIKVAAHEVSVPAIVDTDMALDDVRALALILNSPHIQVKAIVTSDGSSSPRAGYVNVCNVLKFPLLLEKA